MGENPIVALVFVDWQRACQLICERLNLNAIGLRPTFNTGDFERVGNLFDWFDLLGASVLYPTIYEIA